MDGEDERLDVPPVSQSGSAVLHKLPAIDTSKTELNGDVQRKKHKKKRKKQKHKVQIEEPPIMTQIEDNSGEIRPPIIDYVLVFEYKEIDDEEENKDSKLNKAKERRTKFEKLMAEERIKVQIEDIGNLRFLLLTTSFSRLCEEAEHVKLEMPLAEGRIEDPVTGCWDRLKDKLRTDTEDDFVSAPFTLQTPDVFKDWDKPEIFFRPSLRQLLTNHILINLDITNKKDIDEDEPMSKKGLPYLLHKGAYKDAFTIHTPSIGDPDCIEEREERLKQKAAETGEKFSKKSIDHDTIEDDWSKFCRKPDERQLLNDTWTKIYKFQPMWKIRNYFGEKVGFYFAWSGQLITSLIFPVVFGLAIFSYGLYLSIMSYQVEKNIVSMNATTTNSSSGIAGLISDAKELVFDLLDVIKESFDNEVTPFFALVMCLWGTLFLEAWKRKNATLAYEWDVDSFSMSEPDRPQFVGTHEKQDPVNPEETMWYYPLTRQAGWFLTSGSVLIIMILMVFISVASVILYRVIMMVDYCQYMSAVECVLVTTIAGSLLNAISILILGRIYEFLAAKLTEWENHRTQTAHDNALIIKLFAFQFANCYSSLFYIAFFRGDPGENGVLGLGPQYKDDCGRNNNCMSMLSFQILILMIVKPVVKFSKDIILPWLKELFRNRKCCRKSNKTDPVDETKVKIYTPQRQKIRDYIEAEYKKPKLGDFTLGEYTEKVIQYGYLMLFASSFPLAPLIAFFTHLFDIVTDAKRMLWWYRRPLSVIADNIGMWYGILQFLNVAGVVSNAFIIAFTSQWGKQYNEYEKLWLVILFEHAVIAVKLIFHITIPDMPRSVKRTQRREKYQVSRILHEAAVDKALSKSSPDQQSMYSQLGSAPASKESLSRSSRLDSQSQRPEANSPRPTQDEDMLSESGHLRRRKNSPMNREEGNDVVDGPAPLRRPDYMDSPQGSTASIDRDDAQLLPTKKKNKKSPRKKRNPDVGDTNLDDSSPNMGMDDNGSQLPNQGGELEMDEISNNNKRYDYDHGITPKKLPPLALAAVTPGRMRKHKKKREVDERPWYLSQATPHQQRSEPLRDKSHLRREFNASPLPPVQPIGYGNQGNSYQDSFA
ncbi:unnamed protein product [Owenia fusiformis]|uniref:Anoctamin n=1 Tax=Owenia fusiformis TaxID=6347 RepID=A0A8J1XKM3_OWEFU|nr:unnamed protein product [Owenia fusiformis]